MNVQRVKTFRFMKNNSFISRSNCCHVGFSLVELLVAMVIGLFLVGGVVSVMVKGKSHFSLEQELSYIQENARFAIDEMAYDIRMAGFFGCNSQATLNNVINNSTLPANWMFSSNGIKGFERGSASSPPIGFPQLGFASSSFSDGVLTDTDVVIINRADESRSFIVATHTPAAVPPTITLRDESNFAEGNLLVLNAAHCRNMAIFQMSGQTAGNLRTVHHGTGGTTPGNCSVALADNSGPLGDNCDALFVGTGNPYPLGSTLMPFISNAYFLHDSPTTDLPSLFRQSLIRSGTAATTQPQELVSGVEDLEILYGVDTDLSIEPDGVVDRYFSADQITIDTVADPPVTGLAWERVISVRLTLILRSSREVYVSNTVVDLGDGNTYNDRFMRQKVSTVINLRNRG